MAGNVPPGVTKAIESAQAAVALDRAQDYAGAVRGYAAAISLIERELLTAPPAHQEVLQRHASSYRERLVVLATSTGVEVDPAVGTRERVGDGTGGLAGLGVTLAGGW
eukprot:TRINITY_DN8078_c0_g2_i2.p2 TRINITY_DN8078_c0_g2~~TRINITY_DN8078_c0_g2_i2.p2  ORF type:complete len:108 (-),score=12.02 TRINITY_DN8078_c0_g2_i2:17-340(-)